MKFKKNSVILRRSRRISFNGWGSFAAIRMTMISITVLLASPAHADKLKVVASFSILGDLVKQVAGNIIDLKVLVGPDGDAHVYEPTPADAKTVGSADIVITNGFGFEGWLDRLIAASDYKGPVIVATKGIMPLQFTGTQNPDPHAWQDLANGKVYVENIRDALMQADKAHAALYQRNAEHYLQWLDTLDGQVRNSMNKIPENRRKVISTHDAFQYFAKAYHVTFIAPQGINPESNLSAADMAGLVDQIRSKKVKALFFENISDSRLMKQLESETGAHIGGTLYSDALSKPEGPANSYLALFGHNVTELTKGMMYNQ